MGETNLHLISAPNNSFYITGNGNGHLYGTLFQHSDQNFKSNIKSIDNALWKVQQLRGVEYTHKIEGTKNIGLIAQEVEHIIPEVVSENEEGTKSVSYQNIVAVLINAIKEQQTQINYLKYLLERNNIR